LSNSSPDNGRATDRIKVLDVELGAPPQPLGDLDGYSGLIAVARLRGVPIGHVELPLPEAGLAAEDLRRIVLRRLEEQIISHHLRNLIEEPVPPGGTSYEELMQARHPAPAGSQTLVTVAVCTRDRTEDLKICLDSLLGMDHPHLDILVVDNAPSSDTTERLVKESYPRVRYVMEHRPGLDWARNRAIDEARGEIIAYTDDDVIVDSGWAGALAAAFEDPEVMAVTGLIVPYELETEAQILFERYGGFGRGYRRMYWRMDAEGGERPFGYLGAGKYGTGANMAYRRGIFERIGTFDPALDVGTVTNGGGDLEMFFRVLKEGYLLAYEPAAMLRHRHRREYAQLRKQLTNNGIGFSSHLVCSALAYPDARADAVKFGLWWLWRWSLRRLMRSFVPLHRPASSPTRRFPFPRDLILAEFYGSLVGPGRYPKARRRAAKISSSSEGAEELPSITGPAREPVAWGGTTVGVRMVDLCQPPRSLDDVADYAKIRVFVTLDGRPIGWAEVANHHRPVSAMRLRDAIVAYLGLRLLGGDPTLDSATLRDNARAALRRRYLPVADGAPARLPGDVPVSVVVATYDRPDDLRNCLRCLTAQETERPVEIVVVDNNPSSGLTSPVVVEFPEAILVTETRQGLSYARNRGFTASGGEIAISVDDDVTMPIDWLEKLVAPFVRPEVMAVTGNVFPLELDTAAQRLFEQYGGLGRGFAPKEADGKWFDSFRRVAAPTWQLGATANAAFRASIFAHPGIGLLEETLGAGTPTGCSEDTYLFYKVLKTGYTVFYEPSAYVWHKHRREARSLHGQIYNYSKGHVAYHLTTLLRDRDPRAVKDLMVRLPRWQARQLARYAKRRLLRRRSQRSLGLILTEIKGNLAGPWSLWKSLQRVKREGRSDRYVPVPRRKTDEDKR